MSYRAKRKLCTAAASSWSAVGRLKKNRGPSPIGEWLGGGSGCQSILQREVGWVQGNAVMVSPVTDEARALVLDVHVGPVG